MRELEQVDKDQVMWYFRAIMDMMKKVFVEEHIQRPTAHDLLCEHAMLKGTSTHAHTHTHTHTHTCTHRDQLPYVSHAAPTIYDGEEEGEDPTSYEGVPEATTPHHPQSSLEKDRADIRGSELDGASLPRQVLLQPHSVLHSHPEYQSIHSWPMTASDAMASEWCVCVCVRVCVCVCVC